MCSRDCDRLSTKLHLEFQETRRAVFIFQSRAIITRYFLEKESRAMWLYYAIREQQHTRDTRKCRAMYLVEIEVTSAARCRHTALVTIKEDCDKPHASAINRRLARRVVFTLLPMYLFSSASSLQFSSNRPDSGYHHH